MSWSIERVEGFVLVRCAALTRVPGIAHAFSTRIGDSLRFLRAAGFPDSRPTMQRQVHGPRVVRAADCAEGEPADACTWGEGDPSGPVPSVRFADCVPVLLADREGRAAAAVHAGWRGTAAEVALRAVEALAAAGIEPARLVAALGPAILSCCYEVGSEVIAALPESARPRSRVDLHDANRRQLMRAGVGEDAIHAAPWCTKCRPDLFFSYRRDGDRAGRMMASVGPAASKPSRP